MSLPRAATERRGRRRMLGAALAVVAAVGLGAASASQLDVQAQTLAAGTAQIADCQAGAPIRVELISSWVTNAFVTTGMRLYGVAEACETLQYRVTLVRSAGAPIEVTGVVPDGGGLVQPPTFGGVPTSSIVEAKVVIHS